MSRRWSSSPLITSSLPTSEYFFSVQIDRFRLFFSRFFFQREEWPLLVVDEGHRLKNPKCQLMAMLRRIQTGSRFLLTGTPVQNNMSEMWSLMNFLLPEIFDEPVEKSKRKKQQIVFFLLRIVFFRKFLNVILKSME